jgi:hypothetical protein
MTTKPNSLTITSRIAVHGWRLTPVDEAIPGTTLRAVWLLEGCGPDAVFSSTAMLEEWLERVEVRDVADVVQLTFLERAA